MPITPMIPGSGLIGWQVLQKTMDNQRSAFNASADMARDTAYFREKIGSISSSDELIEDRTLLRVALSAFGLGEEVNSTYLVKRVLAEGAKDDDALAKKLNDSRYVALASAFNFEETTEFPFQKDGFSADIVAAYDAKIRSDLETLLETEEYVNNPLAAATLEAAAIEAMETTKTYFEENIGAITSVDDFLNDDDILKVALSAFGVEDRTNSKNLLKRVLEEGADNPASLANILGDRGLIKLTKAFGFDTEPVTSIQKEDFADTIIDNYEWQLFAEAVDNVNPAIGTALSFQREAPALAGLDASENTKWYNVLGNSMMRDVFETALGLPNGFSQIDIDKQVEMMKEKSKSRFGINSFEDIKDEEVRNKLIYSYLLQTDISSNAGFGSNQIALTLLSSMGNRSF
ncbi:hypothetical protein GGQ68_000019 [Sagittula marina]|uniref:Flagellar protein n=1 Tax=Sagittula marina TaxID=943940 RepID=A0A7W6DIK5_9RHOB|nr:DUF1217 domain-containing protein [Sagittula marina]MBB3983708.1 hypothetical protein [Sagittula marina]